MRVEERTVSRSPRFIGLIAAAARWTRIAFVAALALSGFLHLTPGTAVRHVRGLGAGELLIAVSEPQFSLNATDAHRRLAVSREPG